MSLYELIKRWNDTPIYHTLNKFLSVFVSEEWKTKRIIESEIGSRRKNIKKYINDWRLNGSALANNLAEHMTPINQPLVIISEAPRSGGSLLSRLFDMHPQCHAHPQELKIGYPYKSDWPELDFAGDRQEWFVRLFEYISIQFLREGYSGGYTEAGKHQFVIVPALQYALFMHCLKGKPQVNYRAVFDAYMTSYFNAWLNNRNLEGDKRWVIGFTPDFSSSSENVARFFEAYPDGKMLSIIREPKRWYHSARNHHTAYKNINFAMNTWCKSAEAMLDNFRKYPDKVVLISFDNLINNTKEAMTSICRELDIDWHDSLLTPTFNGHPIQPNSSFGLTTTAVSKEAVERKVNIPKDELLIIEKRTKELFQSVMALTKTPVNIQ